MRCPKCGNEWKDGSEFCGECGARLPKPSKSVLKAILSAILFIAILFTSQYVIIESYLSTLLMSDGSFKSAVSYLIESSAGGDKDALDAAIENFNKAAAPALEKAYKKITEHINLLTLIGDLIAVLVICLIFRIRKREPVRELKIRMVNPLRLLTFALLGAALSVFISYLLGMIPFPEALRAAYDEQIAATIGESEPLVLRILAVVVVVPIAEELVFRVLVMRNLKPTAGRTAAIIVSALFFGFAHFDFTAASLISVAYAAVAGLLFAMIFSKYESAIPSIICHAAFNAVGIIPLSTEKNAVIALTAIAAAVIAFCIYRIFFRYPTFSDVLFDMDMIEPINEEEKLLFRRIREIQHNPDDVSRDEIDSVTKAWEDNRAAYYESRKHRSSEDK